MPKDLYGTKIELKKDNVRITIPKIHFHWLIFAFENVSVPLWRIFSRSCSSGWEEWVVHVLRVLVKFKEEHKL